MDDIQKGYREYIAKDIQQKGKTVTLEQAEKKFNRYDSEAKANYAIYKNAMTKDEAQSHYVASQNAYAKRDAWGEVIADLLCGLLQGVLDAASAPKASSTPSVHKVSRSNVKPPKKTK